MCGIAGIVNVRREAGGESALRRMTDALAHRGPDGSGVHWRGDTGFGHRRLAIIGLSEGHQPVVHQESGVRLVFNGELYNYIEIAEELGVFHKGISDTDVLLYAYLKWGISMLPRLCGMFAFVIHDPRDGLIHMVRDRLGIKPLYYWIADQQLAFASELEALMCSSVVPHEIDANAIAAYLRMGYVPTPSTIYRHVRKLPPACHLRFNPSTGQTTQHVYWAIEPQLQRYGEAEATEKLGALLKDVVSQHLRSDVAYGAFLSGGIDSTLVVDQMSSLLDRPIHTYTMAFAEDQNADLPYAAKAADVVGTCHKADIISGQISPDFLARLAAAFGEPFADSSFIPTSLVSRLAATDVKMVLSGDGGDELFGGYHSYTGVAHRLGKRWALPLTRLAGRLIGGERGIAYQEMGAEWQEFHLRERTMMSAELAEILMPAARFPGFRDDDLSQPEYADPILRCQVHDINHYLLDDILTKVDRMSMIHGLEVRVPLLDHRIVEFAMTLPSELRVRRNAKGYETKVLLKNLLRHRFKPSFIERRKMGFGIPLAGAFHGSLKDMIEDLLLADQGGMVDHFDGKAVRRIVEDYYAGASDQWVHLWTLLCLRLWFQSHAARASNAAP